MQIQQWLTIAGASTLVAGTVASLSIPGAKPMAIFATTTTGLVSGILLTNAERLKADNTKEKNREQMRFQDATLAALTHLENRLQQNTTAVTVLNERFSIQQLPTIETLETQFLLSPESDLEPSQTSFSIGRVEKLLQRNSSELAAIHEYIHQQNIDIPNNRKTAVLYDIENLLKGYNISQEILTSLSLKEILDEIKQTGKIGQILVQQAFANWSDSRLKVLRGEINDLGIDPIQVFGFSRELKKNAADIELVISAIDLAYIRPSIEVYVIVSGDGGFASLAKKLHEYGKTVIGCAYQNSTSKTFQSVCDEFILIPDPEEVERQYQSALAASLRKRISDSNSPTNLNGVPAKLKGGGTTGNGESELNSDSHRECLREANGLHPLNHRLLTQLNHIKQINPESESQTIAITQEILSLYLKDPQGRTELATAGIDLSVVNQVITYAIPTLNISALGFVKFTEFMQYVCQGLELCIARVSSSKVILCLCQQIPEGVEVLPNTDVRESRLEGFQPINARLIHPLNQIKKDATQTLSGAVTATKEILNLYAQDPGARAELVKSGMALSVAQQAVSYIAPDLQPIQFGFAKFVEYLQYVCQDSLLCTVRIPPSKVVLALREQIPPGANILPDLEPREVHSVDTYRSILASGSPIYRLPSASELYAITTWVVAHPIVGLDLGSAIEDIVTGLGGDISSEVVKLTLLSFVSAELFLREPEQVHISEQKLTLHEHARSREAIMGVLKTVAQEKLATVLSEVKPQVLEQILPDAG